ncbi:glycosyltransferase family 1 protein [bacterium]|nr:glycosyltransferase family 1 protein [bacterium]
MKIAQIVCSFPPYKGGIGNVAYRLQKNLEKEIEIETFTIEHEKNKNKKRGKKINQKKLEEKNKEQKNVHYLKPVIKVGQAGILTQLLFKLNKFDIVILHYPFFGSTEILYLKRILNRQQKLIILYHMDVIALSGLYKVLSKPGEMAGKKLFKQADKIVVSSLDYIKNSQIKNIFKKYPEKFIEIPFSVDEKIFKPEKKEIDKIKENNKNINLLFVGGLDKAHYFKGVDKLIKSLSLLEQRNWHLNIIGSGNLLNSLKFESKKLGLDEKITFLNKVEDKELIKRYQEADILILPSINNNEAFGLVIIEAMACKTAIIASDLPGVRTVFNEKCGRKVKPNNIEDLKKKIENLLKNPKKIEEMKKESYKLFKEKYIKEKEITSWLNILKEK